MSDNPCATSEKEEIRRYWAERAPFWEQQAETVTEMADRFNQPLLDSVDIGPGHRVLDLASGAGEPALTIARRVSPEGSVTATDLVDDMLAGARRRADAARLDNIRFRQADMENLPFPDQSFDRLTCRFGIMFVPSPDRALAEALRVLVPGGRAGFMVWGPIEDTTLLLVFRAAISDVLGADSGIDLDAPFQFGETGLLARSMSAAGFIDAEEHELRFSPTVPSGQPFWGPQLTMTAGSRLASAAESEREALDAAIRTHLAAHRDGDVYHLAAHVRIAVGGAPGA